MNLIDLLLAFLEILMLFTAFRITTYSVVNLGVIKFYQWQCYLLAIITSLTACKRMIEEERGILLNIALTTFILILPLFLGLAAKYLLARATVIVPGGRIRMKPQELQAAEYIWLEQEGKSQPYAGIFFVGLVILAGVIAFLAFQSQSPTSNASLPQDRTAAEKIGLMIALSLHLIGLYNTATKGDIISQVIGLLTMDHGLYLAIVKIVVIPVPATFFIVGIYFYTLITMAIVVLIVPQVRHEMRTIDLDKIARQLSDLEG